jgi:hypothetical protein
MASIIVRISVGSKSIEGIISSLRLHDLHKSVAPTTDLIQSQTKNNNDFNMLSI